MKWPTCKPKQGGASSTQDRGTKRLSRQTTPNASMASATFLKPAMFAPFT
jgi:hypothetical protein